MGKKSVSYHKLLQIFGCNPRFFGKITAPLKLSQIITKKVCNPRHEKNITSSSKLLLKIPICNNLLQTGNPGFFFEKKVQAAIFRGRHLGINAQPMDLGNNAKKCKVRNCFETVIH